MAWIESHQELGAHPKLGRLARALGVSRPTALGHLHLLWYWALDYAPSGDISRYRASEIARAAEWEGKPGVFTKALRDAGFLDPGQVIHDWPDYAGKLIERRRADAARKRAERAGVTSRSSGDISRSKGGVSIAPSGGRPADARPESGHPDSPSGGRPRPENSTLPEGKDLKVRVQDVPRPDVDGLCRLLADLVEGNGSKRPTVTVTWQTEARLLLDRDGRSPVEAETVMRWCQDDEFWKGVVLSMPKFRAKYDQLRLAMERASRGSGPREDRGARLMREAAARLQEEAKDADKRGGGDASGGDAPVRLGLPRGGG